MTAVITDTDTTTDTDSPSPAGTTPPTPPTPQQARQQRHRVPGNRPRVTVRAAPRREPPFDDEVLERPRVGPHDRCLPFAVPADLPSRVRVPRTPGLPDPAAWGRRLLIGLIEAADGRRPVHQFASMLSLSVGRGVRQDFEQPSSCTADCLRRGTVRSVLVCEPAEGVAELAATIGTGTRVRAVALRLEERRGRWCCTRLQLG